MTEPIGRRLPRAQPITMTFYDWLLTYPYSTTFYVRADTTDEDCHRLIEAVRALSACTLGQYKIGYQQYVVPDYHKAELKPNVMGTFKWLITYHDKNGSARRHTIPGRSVALALGAKQSGMGKTGKKPDPNHPLWKAFLAVFAELCVTKEGEPITGYIELGYTDSNWPPKGWEKRR
jgi:hypothetical protein